MLSPEQLQTIEQRVRALREEHVAQLHTVTNGVLNSLTPGNRHEYAVHVERIVSGTLNAVSLLGKRLVEDLLPLLSVMKATLTKSDRDQILEICNRHFSTDLYGKRIDAFKGSFHRRMAGYGLTIDLETYRLDLLEARCVAGAANALRRALSDLKSAIDGHVYADTAGGDSQPPPSFFENANEVVDIKPNFFGIGINVNKLLEVFFGRRRKKKHDMQATREDARA